VEVPDFSISFVRVRGLARVHPDRTVGAVLTLPDRNAGLYRLDSFPARGKRFLPVWRRRHDDDCHIPDRERSDTVLNHKARLRVRRCQFARNLRHLLLGHRPVRLVLETRHSSPVVSIPDDTDEKGDPAVGRPAHRRKKRRRIDRLVRQIGHDSMIRRPEAEEARWGGDAGSSP
jgi:hypothetical protein